jgi:colanic acid/amylovoran biosynthesis protein
MEKEIKILVINIHSSQNAGDALLAEASIQQLRKQFPKCQITLALNDPDHYKGSEYSIGSFFHFIKPIRSDGSSPWKLGVLVRLILVSFLCAVIYRLTKQGCYFGLRSEERKLIHAYMNTDIVVTKPGNILISSGTFGVAFLVNVYLMFYANLLRKPHYLFPVSIGPVRRFWEKFLVKTLLMNTRMIMLREEISLKVISDAGVRGHPRCFLFPDTTFGYTGSHLEQAAELFNSNGIDLGADRPIIGITAMQWSAQNPYFLEQNNYENCLCSGLVDFTKRYGGKVILFPQVTGPTSAEDDRIASHRIKTLLEQNNVNPVCLDKVINPELLWAAYGKLDLLIGTRMHSVIFALAQEVPVISIGYLHKARGLMQMVGLDEYYIDIDQMQAVNFSSLIEKLWVNREGIKTHIHDILPSLKNKSLQPGYLIAKDYTDMIDHSR